MEVKGKVLAVLPQKSGEGKNGTWTSQSFVIEEIDGQYPKKIAIQIFGDKPAIPLIGEIVNVSANVESKEYNGNWFTNITAWKIDKGSAMAQQTTQQPAQAPTEEGTGLPFN